MLLQLKEPNQPTLKDTVPDVAIGIDLGTTHSLACYQNPQDGEILNLTPLMPSVVRDADFSMASVKRLMGRGKKDLETGALKDQFSSTIFNPSVDYLTIETPSGFKTPVDLSAEILKNIKVMAEENLNQKIFKAVITVPAYFDEAARQATKDAARLAGLEVLRLVNEPTAAALAYGLDLGAQGLYAIYDLGGGTFDFSILKLHKGVFQVIATNGDGHLGGDDIDQAILHHFDISVTREALLTARRAKESLSSNVKETSFNIKGKKYSLTLGDFEKITHPFLKRTLDLCEETFSHAHITPKDLDGLVLVGGSTKMTYVSRILNKKLGLEPLTSVDPDRTVAWGAARQAHALTHGSDTLLMDITPLSLGLEIMGGIVDKIIDRNTPIPVSKAKKFTTYKDNQTGLMLHILQGEREMVNQCRSLGHFKLMGIPPMVAGAAKIKVTFKVDTDGLLTVSALEETTGISQKIEVKPSFGLNEEQMRDMIMSSLENAQSDVETRLLAESKVEANGFLEALLPALAMDRHLLNDLKFDILSQKLDVLDDALVQENREDIERAVKDLEKATGPFAERRMGGHIKKALEGKSLNEVQQALDES